MTNVSHHIQRLSALVMTVVLGACTLPYVPSAPTVKADRQELMEVFSAGYRNITEKYIEEVSAGSIALNGLGGFSSIDPALKIDLQDDLITLTYAGDEITSMKAPEPDNIIGWAEMTSDMTSAATLCRSRRSQQKPRAP